MNQIVKAPSPAEVMEAVLVKGDLAKLTVDERNNYYRAVCESVGLNPLTKPFEFITLNGKLRMYALKDCTDQLRKIHKVSVTDMIESEREGVYIIKSKVQDGEGRTDMAIGAVNIAGLKGEALANAMMKTETKSKRRATLSICGLGMLDETEVEDIPDTQKRVAPATKLIVPSPSDVEKDDSVPCKLQAFKGEEAASWVSRFLFNIDHAKNVAEMESWVSLNAQFIAAVQSKYSDLYTEILDVVARKRASFAPKAAKPDPISSGPIKAPETKVVRNIEKDYDGHIQWLLLKIREADDSSMLGAFWETQIEPDRAQFFPADLNEITDAYERKQLDLNGEGS